MTHGLAVESAAQAVQCKAEVQIRAYTEGRHLACTMPGSILHACLKQQTPFLNCCAIIDTQSAVSQLQLLLHRPLHWFFVRLMVCAMCTSSASQCFRKLISSKEEGTLIMMQHTQHHLPLFVSWHTKATSLSTSPFQARCFCSTKTIAQHIFQCCYKDWVVRQ